MSMSQIMTLSLAHTYKIVINKWTWIINIITNVNMKPQVFSFSTWNKIYICFPCSFHCFPIFILAMSVIFKCTCKLIPWADKKQEKLFLFFPFTIYIINLQTMYLLDPFDFWLWHLKSFSIPPRIWGGRGGRDWRTRWCQVHPIFPVFPWQLFWFLLN